MTANTAPLQHLAAARGKIVAMAIRLEQGPGPGELHRIAEGLLTLTDELNTVAGEWAAEYPEFGQAVRAYMAGPVPTGETL